MQIKGTFKKLIYNRDNYYVGLIKVKDSDYPGLNDKTITFTGYFSDINIENDLTNRLVLAFQGVGDIIIPPKNGQNEKC